MKRIVVALAAVSIVAGVGSGPLGLGGADGARPASEVGELSTDGRPAYLLRSATGDVEPVANAAPAGEPRYACVDGNCDTYGETSEGPGTTG